MTTDENVYVENGKLVIKPILQDLSLITGNTVINLTADATCSSTLLTNCVAITDTTSGSLIPSNPAASTPAAVQPSNTAA